jgi:ABC-type branched-subunit amino acid transport system permease subunit
VIVVAVVGAVVPFLVNGARLPDVTATVAFVLVFASLGLLVGLSRQVSLCHAVFVVFGATNLAHLQASGVPFLPALLIGALFMVPVAALLALPAIRLSGLFLALATFGFGLLAQNLLFLTRFVFGDKALVNIRRPNFIIDFRGDRAFHYLVLAIVVLGVAGIEAIRVTRLGRLLRALADSPTGVQSLGVVPTASRVLIFCVSGFLAAIAGGLLGGVAGSVTPATFDYFQSLIWVTVLATAGAATLGGAVLAAIAFKAIPAIFTSASILRYQPVVFGVAAIILSQAPNGLATLFRLPDFGRWAELSRGRLHSRRTAQRHEAALDADQGWADEVLA